MILQEYCAFIRIHSPLLLRLPGYFGSFLAFLLFTLFSPALFGQIRGKITEKYSGTPLPYVHISTANGQELISDIDGNFTVADTLAGTLTFSKYLHRSVTVSADTIADSLYVALPKYLLFEFEERSSPEGMALIKQVMAHKKENEIIRLKHLKYTTYNKATFTPEKVEKTNKALVRFFRFLSLKFNRFHENQHFLLFESVTNKKVYNRHHYKEVIEGAKAPITDIPYLFVQTSQLNSFTPYQDFISVGGKMYVSPLAQNTINRYAFNVIDTIHSQDDTIFVVKFNPLHRKNFDGLKGLLFINTRKYALQYMEATPPVEKKLKMTALQSFRYYPEANVWFPDRTKTIFTMERGGEKFTASLTTYISELDLNYFTKKRDFDEVVILYPPNTTSHDTSYWNEKRAIPLTEQDKRTYEYYEKADQKKYIERSLKIGEDIYYGFIPYKIIDLQLRRFADVNGLEGLRIGIGGNTNDKFSDRFILGAYAGYGLNDQKWKYGTELIYKLRKYPLSLRTSLINDVREAAGVFFPFNKPQYSSETLRRLQLRIMDRVLEWENGVMFHPLRYFDGKVSLSVSRLTPTYDYQYRDLPSDEFSFTELRAGFRYAYGEQFIQLIDRKISTATPFPVVSFLFTKGFKNVLKGQFDYERYDLKIEYTFKVLDFGTTGAQLITGMVRGAVPYSKLYNETGSYRNFSPVIHNSFETMKYNEFLSDRYISLFLSHDLGRLYFRSPIFRPSLLLLHNIGFGTLSHPEYHHLIGFKTMEKGYFESGLLLDNLMVFTISSLKIGLGPGFFLRYGPYASSQFKNNFVTKLAIRFGF